MNEYSEQDLGLFTEALGLPASERPEYLARACAGMSNCVSVLKGCCRVWRKRVIFWWNLRQEFRLRIQRRVPWGEKADDRIGRYKLLQQIGEGGCGVVFMAEQEEPVRRRVALKIVKPGMDTKNVIARFEAERQALALMDHPISRRCLTPGRLRADGRFL